MADTVNFYEELGLGRDDTVEQIHEDLKQLKLELSNKVTRPSTQQDRWMQQLEWLDQAAEVFADEDSRERYDIELGRTKTSDAAVDWTTRAWNYYFVGDNGAALIASRKAKEQSPGEAMPFVVSAWVQLREGEEKQAKHDADEAFVLDELTTDSVDVQEVRGSVYLVLRQYERALSCFDRALAKATDGEKPELYWRRALTYEGMDEPQQAFESACTGLSQDVVLTAYVRSQLELATSNAVHTIVNTRDAAALDIIRNYQRNRDRVAESLMQEESKSRILLNIDLNIAHWKRLQELQNLCATDAAVPPPDSTGVALPVAGIGCGSAIVLAISGLLSLAHPAFGIIGLLIVVGGIFAYVSSRVNKRNALAEATTAYQSAQARLAANGRELQSLQAESVPLRLQLAVGD